MRFFGCLLHCAGSDWGVAVESLRMSLRRSYEQDKIDRMRVCLLSARRYLPWRRACTKLEGESGQSLPLFHPSPALSPHYTPSSNNRCPIWQTLRRRSRYHSNARESYQTKWSGRPRISMHIGGTARLAHPLDVAFPF